MKLSLKKISVFLIFIYLIIGIYLSLNTGISHDEFHEQQNWTYNLQAIKDFFSTGEYANFLKFKDRYHGIGFHYLSQPIQYLFSSLVEKNFQISEYGGLLISKHIAVFLIFFISGVFLFKIFKTIHNDNNFAFISTGIYYLFPYLLGHSLFNPKDIPFLSVWVICTYYIIKLIKGFKNNNHVTIKSFLILSFLTAFLISIRTLGLLVLLQYLIFLIVFSETHKQNLFPIIIKQKKNLLIFFTSLLLLTYILNPIFWHNPLEIINSVTWMGKYQQDICTTTLGKCMKALNLPASYYFIWLFFKLPIIILFGLALYPFAEKKLSKNIFANFIIISLLITSISILAILIILKVAIYDELRHIMFLIPLIFIISLSCIYIYNKKIFAIFGILTSVFFIAENISINPYQYTWMNSFAKFYNISKNFEVDYWGISNKALSNQIKKDYKNKEFKKTNCIYGGQYTDVFLQSHGFTCFKSYSELDSAVEKPYYVIKNVRNIKRSNPKDCQLIKNETFNYLFDVRSISAGSLWYCN